MRQDRECWYCGTMESVEPIHLHHVEKRSTSPDRIDDESNKMPLCVPCHVATERSDKFYKMMQTLWRRRST